MEGSEDEGKIGNLFQPHRAGLRFWRPPRRPTSPLNLELCHCVLRVEERTARMASPEVGEDDHTCNRCIRAPQ
jgi:hypothetical protein